MKEHYAPLRPRQRFVATFGGPNQVFELGGWRFVFLDNVRKNPAPSPRWIERAIASGAEPDRGTLLFTHLPPFDPLDDNSRETAVLDERRSERLQGWMRELHTSAAFFGHFRGYDAREIDAVRTYVTAAAGAALPPGRGRAHFLDVTLSGGAIQVERRRLRAPRDAELVTHDLPERMQPGERRTVHLTFRNVGTETWRASAGFMLSAPADRDPFHHRRADLPGEGIVAPGEAVTFAMEFRAPAEPGEYETVWMMIVEDIERFGELIEATIVVGEPRP